MDTLHARADWERVGDKWFRKTEQYTAVFGQDLDLDGYIVTGAPYAGALALSTKPAIEIYSLAGKKLRNIPWDSGTIKGLGWSEEESLLVVAADGNVRCYDMQGDFSHFSLGNGADNYGVESCR
jgi:WD40 repeat protein